MPNSSYLLINSSRDVLFLASSSTLSILSLKASFASLDAFTALLAYQSRPLIARDIPVATKPTNNPFKSETPILAPLDAVPTASAPTATVSSPAVAPLLLSATVSSILPIELVVVFISLLLNILENIPTFPSVFNKLNPPFLLAKILIPVANNGNAPTLSTI